MKKQQVSRNTEIYMTQSINHFMKQNKMREAITKALLLFNMNEWGDLCEQDIVSNIIDLENETGRILGKYDTPMGDIYITMEFFNNCRIQTIMFCDEY